MIKSVEGFLWESLKKFYEESSKECLKGTSKQFLKELHVGKIFVMVLETSPLKYKKNTYGKFSIAPLYVSNISVSKFFPEIASRDSSDIFLERLS